MLPKYCEAYHWGLFVMPVTVILLAPCQKHVMNLMALFNVRKASKAGNAMNTFITLTRAIKFIQETTRSQMQASKPVHTSIYQH